VSGIVAELLDFASGPEQLSAGKRRRSQFKTGIAPENGIELTLADGLELERDHFVRLFDNWAAADQ
jgi:hypothetical protein